ncbi:mannonate dehydratase [Parahaliea mediterranea]|uniref:Mannonate dehydratase n=1 Tax=Parahaliea mediterranea TaxID=651086 RepID=A0A939DC05_9GAMM|nr:mannonate dehydratase [Parahaliea mediterranea]MBN7795280.1 mannonate dehydratase [Parahaliea mediterranea]
MLETWRWFGPSDTVTLKHIRQSGARGVVTSLHDVATGDVWTLEAIEARKALIEAAGLRWEVVESLPLHNDIKTRSGDYARYIDNYRTSLRHLAEAGIEVVCYNFMPVVDWTRTSLMHPGPDESKTLRFEMTDFAAYDVYMLERENAERDYPAALLARARERFAGMSAPERELLEKNIIAGLPGGEGSYGRDGIREAIAQFIRLGETGLKQNLQAFLNDVLPVAEAGGIRLCVHPDDPPFTLFGLPRAMSTADDARALFEAVPSPSNGLTLCAGSFGSRPDNNLADMAREFGERIFFVHLRNVQRDADGSFCESGHITGDNDMVALIEALLDEEARRDRAGRRDRIPMRPDHGQLLEDESNRPGINPGYSYAGRLKGLAELRGVIHALESLRQAGRLS